jgi:hypothetical protein
MRLIALVLLLLLGACAPPPDAPEAPGVTPSPTAIASPTPPGVVTPTPVATTELTPTPLAQPPAEPALLPAPFYLIDSTTAQVLRVAPDGQQLSQITFEQAPVLELAVAAETGTLFYLVGDAQAEQRTLYALDGAGRREIFTGQMMGLVASPDGQRVAFRLEAPEAGLIIGQEDAPSGVWVSFATGMRPSLVLADMPVTGVWGEDPAWRYLPIGWSPDGDTLALFAYDQNGPALPGGEIVLLGPGGQVVRSQTCCELPVWSADSRALYNAGGGPGPDLRYGLYRNDAQSGVETALIAHDSDTSVPLVFAPRQLADGQIYALVELASAEGFSWEYPFSPALTQVGLDGSLTPLSPPLTWPAEALWADDGSGALVASYVGEEWEIGGLYWQPATISAAVELPVVGEFLAWAPTELAAGNCSMFVPLRYQDDAARQADPAVRDLQARLTGQGFATGALDGLFGAQTREALAAFQTSRGLASSGELDCATWQALLR